MYRRTIIFASLCLSIASVQALTLMDAEYVCPLDGKKFTARTPASYSRFGMCLDWKPVGAMIAPIPLPKCPGTGFVLYKKKFSETELTKLRAYVATPEYTRLRKEHTDYYIASKLQILLGESDTTVAFTLTQASWEAKTPIQYIQYAEETLSKLDAAMKTSKPEQKAERTSMSFLIGELSRRLGKLDAAEKHFSALLVELTASGGIKDHQKAIIELQQSLIQKKDSQAYLLPQKGRGLERCPQ